MIPSPYRFGTFRLDPAKRELWHGDIRLHLQPKAFDCLTYLIANRNRAVGRDELIAAVWGRADITDNILGQVIAHARRTINDSGEEQRAIRTVPRFGYTWVAPVEPCEAITPANEASLPAPNGLGEPNKGQHDDREAPVEGAGAERNGLATLRDGVPSVERIAGDETSVRPTPHSRSPFGRRHFVGALVLLGIAIAIGMWTVGAMRGRDADRSAALPRENLALVLPVTVKADEQSGWVRLGIMDLIAQRLRASGEKVVPSDNVVALARGIDMSSLDPLAIDRLANQSTATLVMDARAEEVSSGWRVTLRTVYGHDPALTVEGASSDVLDAARTAADRMALLLGLTPPIERDARRSNDRGLAAVLQQVEAAILAERLDTARTLLDGLDVEQRRQPEVRYRLAQVDWRAGRLDAAQTAFEALLDDVSGTDNPLLRARLLNDLGNIYMWRYDYARVERNADEVVALLARYDAPHELGRALTGRAIARGARRQFDGALEDFAQARIALDSIGDRLGLASVDANLGILDSSRDRFAEALPTLNAASQHLEELGNLPQELLTRVALAYAQLALLDPASALANEGRLSKLIDREPNASLRGYANLARSRILAANGKVRKADALLTQVSQEAAQAKDTAMVGWAGAIRAQRLLADGDASAAAEAATAALHETWGIEDPREYAHTWLTLERAELALGQTTAAQTTVADAATWADQNDFPAARIYSRLVRAEQAASTGAADDAKDAFEEALARADSDRVPIDQLRVAEGYAGWLLRNRDLPRAGIIAARAAQWTGQDYAAALLQLRFYHALGNVPAWGDALAKSRALAGEREIPTTLTVPPLVSP